LDYHQIADTITQQDDVVPGLQLFEVVRILKK